MIGRLVQAADFKRLMAVPPAFRSAHFAVHHLVESPVRPTYVKKRGDMAELSTGRPENCPQAVEDLDVQAYQGFPCQGLPRWLGCVVPKRHARRAVTRNLIKRQIYGASERVATDLPGGMWLVRLKQPFPKAAYPSAASDPLRAAVRMELDKLFRKAVQGKERSAQAAVPLPPAAEGGMPP